VVHLSEQGLQRLADSLIVEKANQESRIALTFDLDFSDLLAISGESLLSVIL
jgi:predicted nuclease of predicted toxin-antitoxin system